ncbi:MAG: hypothetical protein HQL72_05140 [Magnetococcales bacterium]|nr:hypothetical protein [Magnetococcales bacterium]
MNWRALMHVEDHPSHGGSQYSHNSQNGPVKADFANIANIAKEVEPLPLNKADPSESMPVPVAHRQQILTVSKLFFQMNEGLLGRLGWNREDLFSGLDPNLATTYDDLPGLSVMLAEGAELIHADRDKLEFDLNGRRLVWVRDGYWMEHPREKSEPSVAVLNEKEEQTKCYNCGGIEFWKKPSWKNWNCGRCHPPTESQKVEWR